MNKINEGLGAVGKLIDENMHESMSKILSTANEELRLSSEAVSKWQDDYDMSVMNVNAKIKQQQDAYDKLHQLVDQMELKILRFEVALSKWSDNDLMKAFKTIAKTYWVLIFPVRIKKTVVDIDKLLENLAAKDAIRRLEERFRLIKDVLEHNMKYDAI